MTPLQPVTDSESIKAYAYHELSCVLKVVRHDGSVEEHMHIPPEVAEGFKRAASKGRYLQSEISGQYPVRIDTCAADSEGGEL